MSSNARTNVLISPLLALALAFGCAGTSGDDTGGSPAPDGGGATATPDVGPPAVVDTGPAPADPGPSLADALLEPETAGEDDAGTVADAGEPAADEGGEPVGEVAAAEVVELPACALGPFPELLDPDTVPPLAKPAYELAKEIQEVLACCTCYCGCAMSRGHTSLLSCFTDDHAVG